MDAAKIKLNPQFLTDDAGNRQAVVLNLAEYNELIELLEDFIDAHDLDEAIKTAKSFTSLEDVIAEFRRDGLL